MGRNLFNDCKDVTSLKSKYKDIAKRYHPDNGGSNADFQTINTLYLKRRNKLVKGLQFANMRNGVAI